MADIIDNEEVDRDTVEEDVLEQQFRTKYKLLTEAVVSLKKPYIIKLHGTNSQNLAVGLSDNSIEVYQLSNTLLSKTCRLSGHTKGLTEVVFCPKEHHILYSSGQDGVIKMWDTRVGGTCVQEFKDDDEQLTKQYECMDVSCNGRVVCGGSALAEADAYLVFWDRRHPAALGAYWNSHTDDVTQVKFHKEKTELLASGSLDGLLNIYNILEPNEDDALTYSLNVENSVEKLSWINTHQVSCITQSNDLQVWDVDTADLVNSYSREKIARSLRRSKDDDCYLVDVFGSTDGAVLLAGSYGGNGDVLRSLTLTDKRLVPRTNFRHNKQVVRCCLYDAGRDVLVTAGEAGLVSLWARDTDTDTDTRDVAATRRAGHVLRDRRHKPY